MIEVTLGCVWSGFGASSALLRGDYRVILVRTWGDIGVNLK